jgi:hypothetical protein
MNELLHCSKIEAVELDIIRKDGTKVTILCSFATTDKEFKNFVSIVSDITKIKEAERTARMALQAKSIFVANVSHGNSFFEHYDFSLYKIGYFANYKVLRLIFDNIHLYYNIII